MLKFTCLFWFKCWTLKKYTTLGFLCDQWVSILTYVYFLFIVTLHIRILTHKECSVSKWKNDILFEYYSSVFLSLLFFISFIDLTYYYCCYFALRFIMQLLLIIFLFVFELGYRYFTYLNTFHKWKYILTKINSLSFSSLNWNDQFIIIIKFKNF